MIKPAFPTVVPMIPNCCVAFVAQSVGMDYVGLSHACIQNAELLKAACGTEGKAAANAPQEQLFPVCAFFLLSIYSFTL